MTTVGAIMPTFNQAATLVGAVSSVLPHVDRLFVVDDSSTDETQGLLIWLCADYTRRGHQGGTGEAINTGRHWVDGDWITWVSSDNECLLTWREKLLAATAPDVGAVYSGFTVHRSNGSEAYSYVPHTPGKLVTSLDCYYGPSFLIRSDVWTPDLVHRPGLAHDYDHWLRVEEKCAAMGLRIVGVDEPLVLYRLKQRKPEESAAIHASARTFQVEAIERRAAKHNKVEIL